MKEPAPTTPPETGQLLRLFGSDEDAVAGAPAAADDMLVTSYRRLADVVHDLLSEHSLDSLLVRIADTLDEIVPYQALHVYEADEPKRELVPALVRSEWAEEILNERFPFGQGITGWAVENREPVLSNRAHLDPRVRFVPGTPVEPEALIVVPLVARGILKGTLNVYRIGEEVSFSEQEFELAKRFGDVAALALDNAHIRVRLEHQAQTDSLSGLYNHRYFHERLRHELAAASQGQTGVALLMMDIDDFKKVNDVYGHRVGDQVLTELAGHMRAAVRATDVMCRIGGEEFAVIVSADGGVEALSVASRLTRRLEGVEFDVAGRIAVSVGIAHSPTHASNAQELIACAEAAMMTAKARGKNQVVLFDESTSERPDPPGRDDMRSIAHMKMLQSLGAKLNRLADVAEIGMTVANELRPLIDYHNCRVFLRRSDDVVVPVAFQGELTSSTESPLELLTTHVGVGITGRVIETGRALLLPDASACEFSVRVEGTEDVAESMIAVPLNYGAQVIGAIVISKLGLSQFDEYDLRLMEVLAGHAAVALENANLYEAQRRAAESAHALLAFGRELAGAEGLDEVLQLVIDGCARTMGAPHAALWLQEPDSDDLAARATVAYDGDNAILGRRLAAETVAPLTAQREPYLLGPEEYAAFGEPPAGGSGEYAIAPLLLEGRRGAIAVATPPGLPFDEQKLDLLGGLADQAKLAIANALSYESLERTFLATVEALANALEARDVYISSHARWISDAALRVGSELGLEADAMRRLEFAALFHDIGKIGVPNSILLKPGPLDEHERALIELHPELGEKILAPINQLSDVCAIVRASHERWDGLGYPDGKAGEEIPIEARVIFACDAFHAMATDRPYRKRLALDEALRRLEEAAGTQFDPQVVSACLRVLQSPPELAQ